MCTLRYYWYNLYISKVLKNSAYTYCVYFCSQIFNFLKRINSFESSLFSFYFCVHACTLVVSGYKWRFGRGYFQNRKNQKIFLSIEFQNLCFCDDNECNNCKICLCCFCSVMAPGKKRLKLREYNYFL